MLSAPFCHRWVKVMLSHHETVECHLQRGTLWHLGIVHVLYEHFDRLQ